jgi:Tfp pilus assembly protein PilF
LLEGGRLKGYIECYVARSFAALGQVHAVAGQARKAEELYRKAVDLLDRYVEDMPESAYHRFDLAQMLAGLADLLKDPDRRGEAETIRRRVITHYEKLRADSFENPQHLRNLLQSYLDLVSLLYEFGRQTEAAEPYRKALELDPKNPVINNNLAWFLANSPEPGLRDAARALELAKKAVAARPQSGTFRNTLGVAHYRNGDDKAALADLETAMSLRAGGNSFDWFFLAMAHWRLRDGDKARAWFDRAVKWMDSHQPNHGELRRFRAEAQAMLAGTGKR